MVHIRFDVCSHGNLLQTYIPNVRPRFSWSSTLLLDYLVLILRWTILFLDGISKVMNLALHMLLTSFERVRLEIILIFIPAKNNPGESILIIKT